MHGVGPGTIIEGRYALRRRISRESHIERWSAHDTTLEREVALTIVGPDHPNRAGILDAARRAAGVEDTRLIRILDVSTQVDKSYIVEETMSGAESLAVLLLLGSLPAEEARRIRGTVPRILVRRGSASAHIPADASAEYTAPGSIASTSVVLSALLYCGTDDRCFAK